MLIASPRGGGPSGAAGSAKFTTYTVLEGGTATFSVVASGAEPLTYQWRKDGQAVGWNLPFLVIPGAAPRPLPGEQDERDGGTEHRRRSARHVGLDALRELLRLEAAACNAFATAGTSRPSVFFMMKSASGGSATGPP